MRDDSPVKVAPLRRSFSAETLARVAERLAEVPQGPTLIDSLAEDDLRSDPGDITIGTPRRG